MGLPRRYCSVLRGEKIQDTGQYYTVFDQPSPNRVGMNLDLEGAIIVFARFVRMASALPCLAARRDMFKSVFGAPLGTSVALGPYGCTKKTIKLKKRFLW